MIISHKYKFIFIKTNKTAGTSIEIALSKFCGPHDIITPISPEDEELRKNLGYPAPQNHQSPIWRYGVTDAVKWATKGKRKRHFYNHISAEEVIAIIGKEKWDSYYTFCFERSPWDRIISYYYWGQQFKNLSGPKNLCISKNGVTKTTQLMAKSWLTKCVNSKISRMN